MITYSSQHSVLDTTFGENTKVSDFCGNSREAVNKIDATLGNRQLLKRYRGSHTGHTLSLIHI